MEGKRSVLLEIAAAKTVQTAFANVRYFRIGSSKVVLTKYTERESELFQILRSGPPTLSNTEAFRQDLTFDKLIVYYASKGIILNRRTFKKNLGFLMPDGKYNLLAQLLSDDCGINIRLEAAGWHVIILWECEVKNTLNSLSSKIRKKVG